jgi:hypothetical protein
MSPGHRDGKCSMASTRYPVDGIAGCLIFEGSVHIS